MADLTIKEQPSGIALGKSPILYSVVSTDYGEDLFEYIADVYAWQGDSTTPPSDYYRLKLPRNVSTGAAVFDVKTVVTDYFKTMPIIFSTVDDTEEMVVNILIKFGYSYTNGSGTYIEELEVTDSDTIKALNGYSFYSEGVNYYADDHFGSDVYSKFLTDRPLISEIPADTNIWIGLIKETSTTVNKLKFDINGSETVYTSLSSYDDETLLMLNIGIPNLPAHTTPDADITYYKVSTVTSGGTQVSSEYTFNIVRCYKYGYLNMRYLNRFGVWDNFIFAGHRPEVFNVDKSEMMFSPLELDSSNEFVFNEQDGEFKNMTINGRESITLNTGWIDEDWNDSIRQLMITENSFEEDTLDPIVITANSLTMGFNMTDKMINYTIEAKKAYNYINTVN